MSDTLKRLSNTLHRDLLILEDEKNPRSSKKHQVLPTSVIDDIYEDETASKNLREILDELREEIRTGGLGNIVFPVTSINGKTGDAIITKNDIGLGRVDNTADIDKPLSIPQKESIMSILNDYDFHINLQELYDHIMNTNNPHGITIDQLNDTGLLEEFVKRLIALHNFSTEHTVHVDIRRSLATLWELVEKINKEIDERLESTLENTSTHIVDPLAHEELFKLKEDLINKVISFTTETNNDHTKYPTTRAVVEFVANKLVEFNDTLPDIENWIDDIKVVNYRTDLPNPSSKYFRKAYFIRTGLDSHEEVAICRINEDRKSYSWDFSSMGSYSKFDPNYFIDSINGMSLKISSIVNAILGDDGSLNSILKHIFEDYYKKEEINDFHYINDIKILPGSELGSIKYYINDDMETMSENIKVNGLNRLAYLEWVTENEIWDNAIHSNHIINKAIETRHIQDMAVTPNKIECNYGYLIGNVNNTSEPKSHEITLVELANTLRPLIGGWPDPSVPGGNPYYDSIYKSLLHPHLYSENVEYDLGDHSYIRRFKGNISSVPNMNVKTILANSITSKEYTLREIGGSWVYQSDPKEMTVLGGSNITGHTFGTVVLTESGLFLETISIGDRLNAPYDIWIKYTKNNEDGTYNHM